MKPRAIIFDLDWTLCELKSESEKNNHTGEEMPTKLMDLYNMFEYCMGDPTLIILTWRKKLDFWKLTLDWVWNQWLRNRLEHKIIMQKKSMADKNHIFKKEKLIELQEEYDIICMFDDNPLVWDVCAELWILFLQVRLAKN